MCTLEVACPSTQLPHLVVQCEIFLLAYHIKPLCHGVLAASIASSTSLSPPRVVVSSESIIDVTSSSVFRSDIPSRLSHQTALSWRLSRLYSVQHLFEPTACGGVQRVHHRCDVIERLSSPSVRCHGSDVLADDDYRQ